MSQNGRGAVKVLPPQIKGGGGEVGENVLARLKGERGGGGDNMF